MRSMPPGPSYCAGRSAAEASLRRAPVESGGTSATLPAGTGNCFASEPA